MKKRETLIYTILLGSSLLLCPLRSTAQEKKTATTEEKATVPLYQGTYVGLDVLAWEVKYSAVTLPVRGECGGKLKKPLHPYYRNRLRSYRHHR